jgi:flagellar hook-basal body complex protein FliE
MALGGISAGTGGGLPLQLLDGAKKAVGSGTDTAEQTTGTGSFAGVLKSKLADLNALQTDSANAMQEIATGRVDDIAQTMLRIEQSSVSMQMATQVRNKVIEAYQEVLRMQM